MTQQKWNALIIYAVLAVYGFGFASPGAAQIVLYIFLALPLIHLLEYAMVFRVLQGAGGSQAGHFIHTIVFGFVHWLPIWKARKS